jgi:hypothetical protein
LSKDNPLSSSAPTHARRAPRSCHTAEKQSRSEAGGYCGAASCRVLKVLRTRNDCAEFFSP